MGMDLSGRKPTTEQGEYFCNNVWWWHPLAIYICEVAPEIADHCEYWQTNDGDGLNAEDSYLNAQGPRFPSKLASGFERQADILLRHRRLSGVGAAQIIEQPSMRNQPWTAGQGGRGVGGDATLPGLGELTVRLLLLGHQLKTP